MTEEQENKNQKEAAMANMAVSEFRKKLKTLSKNQLIDALIRQVSETLQQQHLNKFLYEKIETLEQNNKEVKND